jgi:uncharacterized protein (TIGR02145 family)
MKISAVKHSPAFKFIVRTVIPVLVAAACYVGLEGCETAVEVVYVTAFSGTPTTVEAGQTVTFTNQSTDDGVAQYTGSSWTFPGGTPATSSELTNVNVVYDTPGTYGVTLNVGGLELTKDNYITVTAATGPGVQFVASATTIDEGDAVTFTDQSTGTPTSWQWTFEGGSPSSSTDQNPTGIIYANQGLYDVTLVATNSDGNNTMVKSEYMVVYAIIPYCSPAYDIEGNMYEVVEIGSHCWMAENLKSASYTNGISIATGLSSTDWDNNTTGAYKHYNDNSSNNTTYGKLYNWYAINNSNGLCPDDWHVATDAEWTDLYNAVGGISVANPKMRSATGWSPNSGNNSSGFTALPGGFFGTNSQFAGLGDQAYFWSATQNDATSAFTIQLYNGLDEVFDYAVDKNAGMSCRCVKD